jgi:hypothetical protein
MLLYGRHTWRGESGRRYTFRCALTKHGIPADSGGIYIFVRRRFAFFLKALYVGKAANLRSRLLGHEKWGKAWWILGATERYTMRVSSEDERRIIEEDLIRGLKPRMNDAMVPRCEDDAPTILANRKKWEGKRRFQAFVNGLFGIKPKAHKHRPGEHEPGYFDPSQHKANEFARQRHA